jgi:hypothetical protein
VALAVFLILMALFTELIITASHSALRENAKLDTLTDAREALDRFALDWSARVRRSDVSMTALTDGNGYTTNFTILSQVHAYSGTRQMAAVSYGMGNYVLQRGILGYNYVGTDATPDNNPLMLSTANVLPIVPVAPATTDYETISSDVFRMSFFYLGTNGFSSDSSLLANSTNLYGVVVTVAALDQQNRKILNSAQLTSLASSLTNATAASPLSAWQACINSSSFAATAGVPKQAASAVRVYQRIFYTKE